jgi:hypothetical protein
MSEFHSLKTHYRSKTPFWTTFQRDNFDASYDKPLFGFWDDPRTGKSKPIVDTACYHFHAPNDPLHITGALIIAWPNGAHAGWVLDAFPESFVGRWQGFIWNTDDAYQVGMRKKFKELCETPDFAVLAIGADSLQSDKCRTDIGSFLKSRNRVIAVGDETSAFANKDALRSRIMHNISHGNAGKYIILRRVLDGTPADKKGPLDFYTQMGFLSYDILGYPNFTEYSNHYAEFDTKGKAIFWSTVKALRLKRLRSKLEWMLRTGKLLTLTEDDLSDRSVERTAKRFMDLTDYNDICNTAVKEAKGQVVEDPDTKKKRRLRPGKDYWVMQAIDDNTGMPKFKNMDEFRKRLNSCTRRSTYPECFPNAKRPTYRAYPFALSPEQRRVYDKLATEYKVELQSGEELTAAHHLTRVLRLQQITSNYIPEQKVLSLHGPCAGLGCEGCDDTGIVEGVKALQVIDRDNNPRMDALRKELDTDQQVIVWARFRQDIDQCMAVAKAMGRLPVQYDGRVSRADKLANRLEFQASKADTFVANQAAASRALPLWKATKHVVVSNNFSFRTRKQLEERAEHGRKDVATDIVDIVALDTVDDEMILPALRTGMDVSSYVLQDKRMAWI